MTQREKTPILGQTPLLRRLCIAVLLALPLGLTGCGTLEQQLMKTGEVPMTRGAPVRDNVTPMDAPLVCFADRLAASRRAPVVIAVGDVKDYTGKYSVGEGNAVTQGGALMVYGALGKLDGTVQIAERFDPVIAERELGYMDRRQLGDNQLHDTGAPNSGQKVPWLPYYGGTIVQSNYYIIGGITELNYNIRSGGIDVTLDQIGPKARTFTQSIAVDLRIVDTRTMMVVRTVSLTKQFTGYEVNANIFRFFGSDLFDLNIGAKGQEPLQFGIRTALEEATMRLVGAVTGVSPVTCIDQMASAHAAQSAANGNPYANPNAARPRPQNAQYVPPPPQQYRPGTAVPINESPSNGVKMTGSGMPVVFQFGSVTIGGASMSMLDQIVEAAKVGSVEVLVQAPDTEVWDPQKRENLTIDRVRAISFALVYRGIAPAAVNVTWKPDASDTNVRRSAPGLQTVAKIKIGG